MASGAMGAGALHNIEPNKPVRMKVLIQCIEAKLQILAIPWMSPQFGKWQKNDGLGRVEAPPHPSMFETQFCRADPPDRRVLGTARTLWVQPWVRPQSLFHGYVYRIGSDACLLQHQRLGSSYAGRHR